MDWANANTYAPWATPDGGHGFNSNPSFSGEGQGTYQQTGSQAFASPLTGAIPWAFGQGMQSKKRASPNFYAPSYQGQLFTPDEGLPSWYTDNDPTTGFYSQAMDNPMQAAPAAPAQSQRNSSMALTGTIPNYIGQMPWMGEAMGYAPSYGNSYGGYSNYGGYGASNNRQVSQYQPFVPTGGQY